MNVLKQLIERRRSDEPLKVFSYLEGLSRKTHPERFSSLSKLTSDIDILRVSHVCKEWRLFVVETGAIRRNMKQRGIADVDDLFTYCFMKQFNNSGMVYGWGLIPEFMADGSNMNLPQQIKELGIVTSVFAGGPLGYYSSFVIKKHSTLSIYCR